MRELSAGCASGWDVDAAPLDELEVDEVFTNVDDLDDPDVVVATCEQAPPGGRFHVRTEILGQGR